MEIDAHDIDEMVNAMKMHLEKYADRVDIKTLDKETYRRMRKLSNMNLNQITTALEKGDVTNSELELLQRLDGKMPPNLNSRVRNLRIKLKSNKVKKVFSTINKVVLWICAVGSFVILLIQFFGGV